MLSNMSGKSLSCKEKRSLGPCPKLPESNTSKEQVNQLPMPRLCSPSYSQPLWMGGSHYNPIQSQVITLPKSGAFCIQSTRGCSKALALPFLLAVDWLLCNCLWLQRGEMPLLAFSFIKNWHAWFNRAKQYIYLLWCFPKWLLNSVISWLRNCLWVATECMLTYIQQHKLPRQTV